MKTAALLCACALTSPACAQIVGPDSYNLAPFAHRLLRERCRCWIVGDSINDEMASANNMPYGWVRELTPTHWAGIACHGLNSGTSPTFRGYNPGPLPTICGFGGAENSRQGGVSDDLGGAAGNIWVCKYSCLRPLASNLAGPSQLTTWIADQTYASMFSGGDWWTGCQGRARLLTFTDAGSIARCGAEATRGGIVIENTTDIPLPPGYNMVDMSLGSGAGQAIPQWSVSSAAYDETGLVQRNLGCRFYSPDIEGLELSFGAVGGSRVADHVDPGLVSDEAIAAAVAWGDIDTVVIWLGANDVWDSEFLPRERALVARWTQPIIAAGRVPKVLLICNYDIAGRSQNFQQEQWDMQTIAQEDPGTVSFYNLYKRAGSSDGIDQYLRDGIHTNFDGALYFASLINTDLVASLQAGQCGSADFDCDGNLGTDLDIAAFFACLGGSCPPGPCASSADFDGDGNLGTDADIAAFFRVLAGGSCW